ncbi:Zinc metalloproteinase [Aphelenchoides fujianensis]|nr:Zinc metalloproteinase [Aphelenchoides fujianensis]
MGGSSTFFLLALFVCSSVVRGAGDAKPKRTKEGRAGAEGEEKVPPPPPDPDALFGDQTGLSALELSSLAKAMSRLNFIQGKLLGAKPTHKDEGGGKSKAPPPTVLFEGDMLLTPRQMNGIVQNVEHQLFLKDIGRLDLLEKDGGALPHARHRRTLISNPIARWSELPILFRIPEDRGADRASVLEGVRLWEETTCLRFEERREALIQPHLNFIRGSGCYSNVGRASLTGQFISIGRGCENPHIVAHEIGHALGFFHEQGRFDRDKFVRVEVDQIHAGFLNQFTKQPTDMLQTFDVEYDIGSSFSYTGSPAIRALDPNYQSTMGQRHELTFNDVKKINLAYCPFSCLNRLECKYSGYADPRNCKKCRCPAGLGGKRCTKPAKTKTECGEQLLLKATSAAQQLEFGGVVGECNFVIRAAAGAKIQLRIEEVRFYPSVPCNRNYLEVKYGGDLGTTGARFCSNSAPMPNLISRLNQVVVLFRSRSLTSRFRLSYTSDEPANPFNMFTNSLAIFSEFFRGFFNQKPPPPVAEVEEKEEEEEEEEETEWTVMPETSTGTATSEQTSGTPGGTTEKEARTSVTTTPPSVETNRTEATTQAGTSGSNPQMEATPTAHPSSFAPPSSSALPFSSTAPPTSTPALPTPHTSSIPIDRGEATESITIGPSTPSMTTSESSTSTEAVATSTQPSVEQPTEKTIAHLPPKATPAKAAAASHLFVADERELQEWGSGEEPDLSAEGFLQPRPLIPLNEDDVEALQTIEIRRHPVRRLPAIKTEEREEEFEGSGIEIVREVSENNRTEVINS